MHAIDLGLIEHQIESFRDILGEKNAAAADKKSLNQYHRTISQHMDHQSEKDFPRRSGQVDYLANSCMTADEKRGNHVPFLVCFHTHGVKLQMQRWFDKYNKNHNTSNGRPTIQGCAEAVEGLLCLE